MKWWSERRGWQQKAITSWFSVIKTGSQVWTHVSRFKPVVTILVCNKREQVGESFPSDLVLSSSPWHICTSTASYPPTNCSYKRRNESYDMDLKRKTGTNVQSKKGNEEIQRPSRLGATSARKMHQTCTKSFAYCEPSPFASAAMLQLPCRAHTTHGGKTDNKLSRNRARLETQHLQMYRSASSYQSKPLPAKHVVCWHANVCVQTAP